MSHRCDMLYLYLWVNLTKGKTITVIVRLPFNTFIGFDSTIFFRRIHFSIGHKVHQFLERLPVGSVRETERRKY